MVESVPYNIEEAGEQLLHILTSMEEVHQDLLECLGSKREAVRRADPASLGNANEAEVRIIRRLVDLDSSRSDTVLRIVEAAGREPRDDVPVSELAEFFPTEIQSGLLETRGRLQDLIAQVQNESISLRDTCGILRGHVDGLVQRIQGEMSRTKVYGRSGRIENESSGCATLDIRR